MAARASRCLLTARVVGWVEHYALSVCSRPCEWKVLVGCRGRVFGRVLRACFEILWYPDVGAPRPSFSSFAVYGRPCLARFAYARHDELLMMVAPLAHMKKMSTVVVTMLKECTAHVAFTLGRYSWKNVRKRRTVCPCYLVARRRITSPIDEGSARYVGPLINGHIIFRRVYS